MLHEGIQIDSEHFIQPSTTFGWQMLALNCVLGRMLSTSSQNFDQRQ